MIPDKTTWKTWNVIEKATYITQVGAALALLPTVLFAFLGWREARLSRKDQVAFFQSEKAPNLEISELVVASPFVAVTLKNVGESTAKDIQVQLLAAKPNGDLSRVEKMTIERSRKFSARKGESILLALWTIAELKKTHGYVPSEISRYDIKSPPEDTSGHLLDTLLIHVVYKDVLSNDFENGATYTIKR
jgi:hypothetical protein